MFSDCESSAAVQLLNQNLGNCPNHLNMRRRACLTSCVNIKPMLVHLNIRDGLQLRTVCKELEVTLILMGTIRGDNVVSAGLVNTNIWFRIGQVVYLSTGFGQLSAPRMRAWLRLTWHWRNGASNKVLSLLREEAELLTECVKVCHLTQTCKPRTLCYIIACEAYHKLELSCEKRCRYVYHKT